MRYFLIILAIIVAFSNIACVCEACETGIFWLRPLASDEKENAAGRGLVISRGAALADIKPDFRSPSDFRNEIEKRFRDLKPALWEIVSTLLKSAPSDSRKRSMSDGFLEAFTNTERQLTPDQYEFILTHSTELLAGIERHIATSVSPVSTALERSMLRYAWADALFRMRIFGLARTVFERGLSELNSPDMPLSYRILYLDLLGGTCVHLVSYALAKGEGIPSDLLAQVKGSVSMAWGAYSEVDRLAALEFQRLNALGLASQDNAAKIKVEQANKSLAATVTGTIFARNAALDEILRGISETDDPARNITEEMVAVFLDIAERVFDNADHIQQLKDIDLLDGFQKCVIELYLRKPERGINKGLTDRLTVLFSRVCEMRRERGSFLVLGKHGFTHVEVNGNKLVLEGGGSLAIPALPQKLKELSSSNLPLESI